jgi:hypothetical protein
MLTYQHIDQDLGASSCPVPQVSPAGWEAEGPAVCGSRLTDTALGCMACRAACMSYCGFLDAFVVQTRRRWRRCVWMQALLLLLCWEER